MRFSTRSVPLRASANVLLLIASVLGVVAVAELALRLFVPADNIEVTATLDIYAPNECCGLGLKPNLRRATYWNGKKIFIRTDARGHRIPLNYDFLAGTGRPQLVFCGDSYTFGNEENAEDTFPFLLGELRDREVINLGVGSYSTFQEIAALRGFAAYHGIDSIDRVFLCFFVGNDFADNLPDREKVQLDARGRIRLGAGVAKEWLRQLVYDSRLLAAVTLRLRTLLLQLEYQLGSSSPPGLYDEGFYSDALLEPTGRAFTRFRDYYRSLGLDAVVVLIPDKDQVYKEFPTEEDRRRPNAVMGQLLGELGIPYVDLLPEFRAHSDDLYNMTPAGHLSVRGHQVTARILHEYLRRRNATGHDGELRSTTGATIEDLRRRRGTVPATTR